MKVAPASIGHHISNGFMRANVKPVCDAMKVVGPARGHVPAGHL